MNNCAFSDIKITPAYGENFCYITWKINPVYSNKDFSVNVYKSRDGYTDWFKLLNVNVDADTGLITDTYGNDVFLNRTKNAAALETKINSNKIDLNFKPQTINHNFHYKLQLVNKYNTVVDETPSIGIYDTLTKTEFATLHSMLKTELTADTWTDFYICRPKGMRGYTATPNESMNDNVDIITGDIIAPSTDEDSFGKVFKGGYSNPIKTKFFIKNVMYSHQDSSVGQSSIEQKIITFKGLSYPRLIKGDLLIHKETDDRYLFESYTNEFYFKGVIPFKYIATMKLLDRNNVEYKFDIKNLKPCIG